MKAKRKVYTLCFSFLSTHFKLRQIIFQSGIMDLILLISSSHWPLDAAVCSCLNPVVKIAKHLIFKLCNFIYIMFKHSGAQDH